LFWLATVASASFADPAEPQAPAAAATPATADPVAPAPPAGAASDLTPAPAVGTPDTAIWSRPEPGMTRTYPGPLERPRPPLDWRYQPQPDSGEPLKEIGITAGTPSVVNLNLGYWGSSAFPFLVRLSGMYYGATRGIQVDAGYVFQREKHFKQYVAVSFVSWQTSTTYASFWTGNADTQQDLFTGIGPTYGLNWSGLTVQIGVAIGQDVNIQSYGGGTSYVTGSPVYLAPGNATVSQFVPMGTFQIGYSFLW
jgi:hypothetical protein